jgi:hypothetical protein
MEQRAMIVDHRHANRAASHACTDPDCAARYAEALTLGREWTAELDAAHDANQQARLALAAARHAQVAPLIAQWQAEACNELRRPV